MARLRFGAVVGASILAMVAVLMTVRDASIDTDVGHVRSAPDPVVEVGTITTEAPPADGVQLDQLLPTAPPPGWRPIPEPPLAMDPPAPPAPLAPLATSPQQAVANAYSEGVAPGRFDRVAVALFDRQTGQFYGAGDIDTGYRAASVVKVLIAARLLRAGRTDGLPLTSDDLGKMWRMIVCSDNAAAEFLWWNRAGGPDGVITWVRQTYGITGIAKSERPGAWGTTWISARGMAEFYARVAVDPAVAPWLMMTAMPATAHYGGCGNGGFDQWFGLPSATNSWAVKQGWVCCWKDPPETQTRLHSTGYVDGFRYVAVLLTEGRNTLYSGDGRSIVTAMARALLPGGHGPYGGFDHVRVQPTGPIVPPTPDRTHPPMTEPPTPPSPVERPRPAG